MSKVDLGAPFFYLGEVSEFAAVVHSNRLKDLVEMLAVLGMEGGHGCHHRLAGLAGDTERKVVLGLLLQQREDYRLLSRPPSNHGIALPVAFFHAERSNLRTV